jgi:uncharacterized protein YjbI with pentapeptide repeats
MAHSDAHEILERYAAGERSFSNLDLDSICLDFSGAVLMDSDFSGSFITANFRGANLARVKFENGSIKCCDFTEANLEGASFKGSAIDCAIFRGAKLIDASFLGASEQGNIYSIDELPFDAT